MASMAAPLRSILKKPTAAPASADPGDDDVDDDSAALTSTRGGGGAATHSRRLRSEEDNAAIARKHAAILQQRRDLEATIFEAIETLTDFPLVRGPAYSAARPAPADAAAFARLVRVFQPGDYDDLIEERNTCGRCGYALCPDPRQTFAGGGTWKLVNAGRRDFGIVAKGELEKWCSAACARRALYIKVQLNETAAWERVGIPDIQVELLEEETKESKDTKETKEKKQTTAEAQLAQDLARLKLGEERRLAQNAQALALERGDGGTAAAVSLDDGEEEGQPTRIVPPAPTALIDVHIVEKRVIMAPTAPTLDDAEASGTTGDAVEGYKIKFIGE